MVTALAAFDVDGTLLKGHIWRALIKYHRERKMKRLFLWLFALIHYPLWFLAKSGLWDEVRFRTKWMEDFAGIFKGLKRGEIRDILSAVLENELEPEIRADLLDTLKEHQAKNHMVVLVSGTFEDLLRLLGEKIGVEHVLGTRVEFREGRCTGRVMGSACMGSEKVRRIQELINERGLEVDLPSSFTYADSISDLPLLEWVGNPVAVEPEEKLQAIAQERGWQIMEPEGE
ncbi:MAG: HAD family hydrolase [Anaerolineae bacterium]